MLLAMLVIVSASAVYALPARVGSADVASTPNSNGTQADTTHLGDEGKPLELHESRGVTLRMPKQIKQDTLYDEKNNMFVVGRTINDKYITTPIILTPDEYQRLSLKRSMRQYYRSKNAENFAQNGQSKFDFTNIQFNLGPAEKIFGPGGVQIKTQGSAEIKVGGDLQSIDNPSIVESKRNTFGFDFDTKINIAVQGKVGDKINMNLNYNTEATFDFDSQKMKLKYEGKEDETIKLIEGGDVSMPSNVGLISGVSSLFGIRTDLQYGKLKLQAVVSQKKSASKSVGSKGGAQLSNFEFTAADYEENRHFFLSHYFRVRYNSIMATAPDVTSGITIKRIEVWVTNKTGQNVNNRNLISFTDLGEGNYTNEPGHTNISNSQWTVQGMVPDNNVNTLYQTIKDNAVIRNITTATKELDEVQMLNGGRDYEKLQNARLLSSSEYSVNTALGTITLNSALAPDEVLAVAFEYTLNGQTWQVGEFSSDIQDNTRTLFLKTLKSTSNGPRATSDDPRFSGTWRLMMRNVYNLNTTSLQREKFRFDVKYQNDTTGVYQPFLPEDQLRETILIRAMGLDRLDANNHYNPDGRFDFIEGFTVNKGRVIFPVVEPFGEDLERWITSKAGAEIAKKYCYYELYDTTKTMAKRVTERNRFRIVGQYKGSRTGEIDLGATNVAPGSVKVTAGGVTLVENSDYLVDYSMGRVTIINQSILDAGTSVQASLESNDTYGMQRKTLLGLNAQYDFSKDFSIAGTFMYLNQQAQTTKVNMGMEPLKNIVWGVNLAWKKESQWLTNMIDELPFVNCTAPSQISLEAEFAQLIAGQNGNVQGGASYIDDFENTKNRISIMQPNQWMLSSVPQSTSATTQKFINIPNSGAFNNVISGYNRALLAWYTIDPIFTLRSSTLTPSHLKGDLDQLSNHYVRAVYERELYPNKSLDTYTSSTSMPLMNIAFYPNERGAYNLTTDVDSHGRLNNTEKNWGGMMRKIEVSDFETSNVEYIEFWMLDPFIYKDNIHARLHLHLGEVSEDILRDGKKAYESGMPLDGNQQYVDTTQWGKVPANNSSTVYAFNSSSGSRSKQDVGLNGLSSEEEQTFGKYAEMLAALNGKLDANAMDSLVRDPASDNYHYYRGSDYDRLQRSILDRYKYINLPEGNSPASDESPESYETAYKTTPDVEDINSDYTLNEYEKYFGYCIDLSKENMVVGNNYIVDMRETAPKLRNGKTETVRWYQFRIPVDKYDYKEGGISDFSSVRFARMVVTDCNEPIVLRFATLDLVATDWRLYDRALTKGGVANNNTRLEMGAVNIEENNDKQPVNYVLPPGISRVTDPTQSQIQQENEQALSLTVHNLTPGDALAVYKNTHLDMRQYKHLQMFVHANALNGDATNLKSGETSLFIRMGSDYNNNYYEYEIPLQLTPAGNYSTYSADGCRAVWPEENMLELDLEKMTNLKRERNASRSLGVASLQTVYSKYDSDRPNNRMSIVGNPSFGDIKTIMLGVRNNAHSAKDIEVWANELRLQQFSNEGGIAAQGTLNLQLSDVATVNLKGHIETAGFGSIEQAVSERSTENTYDYNVTTNVNVGRFLPHQIKLTAPFYWNYRKEIVKPKYNPLDNDMRLDDAIEAFATKRERDSLENLTVKKETAVAWSLSGVKFDVRTLKKPMPWDPANFSFNYAYNHQYKQDETTAWEDEYHWRGGLNYAYSPEYKTWEPFHGWKTNSEWAKIVKELGFNYLPQSITFDTDMDRTYYEMQERNIEELDNPRSIPLLHNSQWMWNRSFSMRWDLTKNLKASFNSATHAEIEQPNVPIDKDRYPDHYQAWKDSVWQSIKGFGTPMDYNQSFKLSYKLPLDLLPAFDWLSADGSFNSNYSWKRGNTRSDGSTLGNTIVSQRTVNINGKLSLEKLYNHSDFLKEVNKKFSGSKSKTDRKAEQEKKREEAKRKREALLKIKNDTTLAKTPDKMDNAKGISSTKRQPKGYAAEVNLRLDTITVVTHNQKSRKLDVTTTLANGKRVNVKYKKLDDNKIMVFPVDLSKYDIKVDSGKTEVPVRMNVVALPKFSDSKIYPYLQSAARFAMMIRNVSISYRNNYSLTLPGFTPNIGAIFGQNTGPMRPGLDFAFGFINDDYIGKARDNGWLTSNDSIATPAVSTSTEDLQIKMSLEPFRDLKIDLNMARTDNRNRSILYRQVSSPITQTGSFNMTTISIGSAFDGIGSADNNYQSTTFDRFRNAIMNFRERVEAQYTGARLPYGPQYINGQTAGQVYDPSQGSVNPYSADVMVPAFLNTYTAMSSGLDIFPSLWRMLPNWNATYKGLTRLPWICDHFKSVNITHGYKSIYAVGSYNTFTSFCEYMNGLGFVKNVQSGMYSPSSMYDVGTVSINESFSPLIGINVTLNNNMTFKCEYRKTRVLTLSMANAKINETGSDDMVFGWGWKINDFKFSNIFGKSGKTGDTARKQASRKVNPNSKKAKEKEEKKKLNVFAHTLNMRFDFSLRNQHAINRDILTGLSEATSGNKAFKISFNADYTMSRYVTLTFYYDRQSTTPLLTNNGFPTVTSDFGLNIKLSLTR